MTRTVSILPIVALLAFAFGCATTSESSRARAIVDENISSVESARAMAPPSRKHGELTLDEAYRIQDLYADERGDLVGYKIAFAGAATQKAFGLDEPVYGPLFERQRLREGDVVPASIFVSFGIETELAFVLQRNVDRPVKDVAELKSYVKSVHLAFDIPDNRFSGKPTAADIVATGAGAHRFLIGPAHDPANIGVNGLSLKATKNDEVVYEGPSDAVVGGQWECLLWAVNHLVARGKTLFAKTLFLTGAVDKPYTAVGKAAVGRYAGEGGELGTIRVTIE